MTAYRVVDDHEDLENIGTHSHNEIDTHIETTPFVLLSGSEIPVTSSARYLEAGSNVTITDNGPGSSLIISSTGGGADFIFPSDLTVSLPGGKTFGRYSSGATIPATGKTPAEVILLAIAEPIDPTVSLSGTNVLTTAFNTVGVVTTFITGSYTINTLGAAVDTAVLEYRTGGVGAWTTLTTNLDNPLQYNHEMVVGSFYATTINYRYVVTDSQGAVTTSYLNIVPQSYASPTMSLSVVSLNGGIASETNTKRERGNIASTLSGTITRQRTNVAITSYSVQYSTNGSTWADVPGLSSVPVVGNPPSVSIPATLHDDAALKNSSSIIYRVRATDEYTTSNSSNTTVNFFRTIFYGPSSTAPVDSTAVRSLSGKVFIDYSNPFNLETGSDYRHFTVALPTSLTITEVLDLDALNANITANYVLSTFDVEDGGGVSTAHNVYTMTNAIPYTSNHRHRITRA